MDRLIQELQAIALGLCLMMALTDDALALRVRRALRSVEFSWTGVFLAAGFIAIIGAIGFLGKANDRSKSRGGKKSRRGKHRNR
jgi:hypothetical protein